MSKPLSPSAMMVLRGLARGLTTCQQLADAGNTSKQGIAWHIANLVANRLIRSHRGAHMAPFTYSLTKKGLAAIEPVEMEVMP